MNPQDPVPSIPPQPVSTLSAPAPSTFVSPEQSPEPVNIPTPVTPMLASKKNPTKLIIIIILALLALGGGAYVIKIVAFNKKTDVAVKSVNDIQRKTTVLSMTASLEEFFATKGHYPSYDQLNSSTFRSSNLPKFNQALSSTTEGLTLSSSPNNNSYAYAVSPSGCDNIKKDCTSFELTTALSTGEYKKVSLN